MCINILIWKNLFLTFRDLNKLQEGIGEKIGMLTFFTGTFILSIITAFVYGWDLTLVLMTMIPFMVIFGGIAAKVCGLWKILWGYIFIDFFVIEMLTENWKQVELFYLNTIEQLFLFVEQLDKLEVYLPYSRLLTGITLLAVFQNLGWNSNKTSLHHMCRLT